MHFKDDEDKCAKAIVKELTNKVVRVLVFGSSSRIHREIRNFTIEEVRSRRIDRIYHIFGCAFGFSATVFTRILQNCMKNNLVIFR